MPSKGKAMLAHAMAEQGVELHRKGVALRFDAKVLHSDAMAVNGTA